MNRIVFRSLALHLLLRQSSGEVFCNVTEKVPAAEEPLKAVEQPAPPGDDLLRASPSQQPAPRESWPTSLRPQQAAPSAGRSGRCRPKSYLRPHKPTKKYQAKKEPSCKRSGTPRPLRYPIHLRPLARRRVHRLGAICQFSHLCVAGWEKRAIADPSFRRKEMKSPLVIEVQSGFSVKVSIVWTALSWQSF